ncbi:MAG: TetR family transcriptional regulator [Lachnospiraceae bacterium]|nr:TetR family transcriptional regulator [Lachnospiraceae bacterium]
MAQKNIEKRTEIMSCAYDLFSTEDYNNVYLKDIARRVNINKSLLQHYYPKKGDIMNGLLMDLLKHTFTYLELRDEDNRDVHASLAIFTAVLWSAIDHNKRLNRFMQNALAEFEIFDNFIESIFDWLKELRYSNSSCFEPHALKIALFFAIQGGMSVYVQKEKLGVSTLYICEEISRSFMHLMGCTENEQDEVIRKVEDVFPSIRLDSLYSYYDSEIEWFRL